MVVSRWFFNNEGITCTVLEARPVDFYDANNLFV